MKLRFLTFIWVLALLCGCQSPGKFIATTSTTVDHAMQSWAVYVADGHATALQRFKVQSALRDYYAAEDLAISALEAYNRTGDKFAWKEARDLLIANQQNLINLVSNITGKAQ